MTVHPQCIFPVAWNRKKYVVSVFFFIPLISNINILVQNFIFIVIKSPCVGIWRESYIKKKTQKNLSRSYPTIKKMVILSISFSYREGLHVSGFGLWSCYKIYSITKNTRLQTYCSVDWLFIHNVFFLITWTQKNTMCSLNFLIFFLNFDPIQMLMFWV